MTRLIEILSIAVPIVIVILSSIKDYKEKDSKIFNFINTELENAKENKVEFDNQLFAHILTKTVNSLNVSKSKVENNIYSSFNNFYEEIKVILKNSDEKYIVLTYEHEISTSILFFMGDFFI